MKYRCVCLESNYFYSFMLMYGFKGKEEESFEDTEHKSFVN